MSQKNSRFPIVVRIAALILAMTFIVQDISWAVPDLFAERQPQNNKLAVTGLQNEETLARLKTVLTKQGMRSTDEPTPEIGSGARFLKTPKERKEDLGQKAAKPIVPDLTPQSEDSSGLSFYRELRGRTVLVVGSISGMGTEIVERLYQENVNIFENFIRSKGRLPDIENKSQCELFLKEGRPTRICVYDMDGPPESIYGLSGLLENKLTCNTGSAILDVKFAPSADIWHLREYIKRNNIFPQLVINISSLGQDENISNSRREQKAFLEISNLAHLLKLTGSFRCKNLWQVFPHVSKKPGISGYAEQIQQKMLDSEKGIKSRYSLEDIMSLIGIKFTILPEDIFTQGRVSNLVKWSETDHTNYFLSGLVTTSLDEKEKKEICGQFLAYKLKKDFGIDNLRDMKNISMNEKSNSFSLDSYIPIIGYLFDERPEREEYLNIIADLWVERNREIVFKDGAFNMPYHAMADASVKYLARTGKSKLLFRAENSVYQPLLELEEVPQNFKLSMNELISIDKHAKKIAERVKNIRGYLDRGLTDAMKSNDEKKIKHFKERKDMLNKLTILGLDSEDPFLFCDLDRGVIRLSHIGRSRMVAYLPLVFIDKAKDNEIDANLDYIIDWLTLYHRYKEYRTPDKVQKGLRHYANMYLKYGKPSFGVGHLELNKQILSLIKYHAVAKGNSFNNLYKDYRETVGKREELLVKYPGGFMPKGSNPQEFAGYWSNLAERYLSLAERFESLADRLTARRLYPEWKIANRHVVASDMGVLPANISVRELLDSLRGGLFGEVLLKFRQYFLGKDIVLQVEKDGKPRYERFDILALNKEAKNSLIDPSDLDGLRALWYFNASSALLSNLLEHFEKKMYSVCEAYYHIYPAERQKVELFKENITILISYFKRNFKEWADRIEGNENIIREEDIPPLVTQIKRPLGSPATCIGAIIDYCSSDFTKTFDAGDLVEAGLRKKKDGAADYTVDTVRLELRRLQQSGVLDIVKDGRKNRYILTADIRNLSPPEKIEQILNSIQQIPTLQHYDIPEGQDKSEVKSQAKNIVESIATEKLATKQQEIILPNVKDGPDLIIRYTMEVRGKLLWIEGNALKASPDGKEILGDFSFAIKPDGELKISVYRPIGLVGSDIWRENHGNGISQTFLYWIVDFAIERGINKISIDTRKLFNMHVFRKYFADIMKIGDKTYDLNDENVCRIFDNAIVGQMVVYDAKTGQRSGTVRLHYVKEAKSEYSVIESDSSLLAAGDVVSIDKNFVYKNGNAVCVMGLLAEHIPVEFYGAPKIPPPASQEGIKTTDRSNKTKARRKKVGLLWQKRASYNEQIKSELLERVVMKDLIGRIDKALTAVDSGRLDEATKICVGMLDELGTRKKDGAKLLGIAALGEARKKLDAGDRIMAKNEFDKARGYFTIRFENAKTIAEAIQRKRLSGSIMQITNRNKRMTRELVDPILKIVNYEGSEKVMKLMPRATREYMREPEFRALLPLIWQRIKGKIGGIGYVMTKLDQRVKLSQTLNEFMEDFMGKLSLRALKENVDYRKIKEEVFQDTYQEFLTKKGLINGPPDLLWTIFYQAVFIPLEINNPLKKSERVSNPVFEAVDALILIKIVDDLSTLSNSKIFRREHPQTATLLQRIIQPEGENAAARPINIKKFSDLRQEEKSQLLGSIAVDRKLTLTDRQILTATLEEGIAKEAEKTNVALARPTVPMQIETVSNLLDADIDNTKTLAASLASLYEDDLEKIIYTIRLNSSKIPGNYMELIKNHYAKILSARSNNVEVKVLGNDRLEGLVGVSIEIGGRVQGNGMVNVAGGESQVESLGRLIGMVNLAISVATIPEEFTDLGMDKYKGFLDIISAQYEALTGERLKLPENPKDVSAFIRGIVMNLPPMKSHGVKPQEEFELMKKKLESAA